MPNTIRIWEDPKMMRKLRSAAVLVLAAALCSASALCTGCAGKNSSSDNIPDIGGSVYIPEVPESRVDENTPGNDFAGAIGETINYADKLDITLNDVIEIDNVNKQEYRVLLAEMTISNKTAEKIDCSTLTHFSVIIDGTEDVNAARDIQAAVPARKYYTSINSPMESFNQAIEGGQTITGYAYIFAPSAWKEMQLVYVPYMYFNTDRVLFTLDEAQFVHKSY